MAALSSAQVGAITTAGIKGLTTAQVANLTTGQVAALSTTALGGLGSDSIIALTTAQAAALGSDQIASLSAAVLAEMETADLAALTSTAITGLTSDAVAALTSGQVRALTTGQLVVLTAWPVARLDVPGLTAAEAAANCGPLAALALYDDPALQAATGPDWINRKAPAVGGPLAPAEGYCHDRIRIGYLSTDFCRHAMSFLIAELLELHDRSRFDVYGYCTSPEDGSDIRARVLAAMDHHVGVKSLTDEQAAARIRADEIDILIDLNGLTRGARVGVLRWKPAPVQITYLGYIGPIPLPELDYILCDAITIPPGMDAAYQTRPLRIDGCYQANDSRPPVLPAVSRTAEGLPEDAFVYCCVSHHYKITESLWGGWCDIVAAVPGSVLWLIDDNPESRAALTARWLERGLAVERLIFAARVDPDRYRARLALADLFLDTTPYSAGTIASDALRLGLPLLTLQGRAFAARMASSLLTAIGLEGCITTTLPDYIARAVAIGQDRTLHHDLKTRLAGDAWARTLGDSAGFTKRFEAVLERVCLKSAAPDHQAAAAAGID